MSLSAAGPAGSVRGPKHRLTRQFTKVEARNQFLLNRIVSNWNKLPASIIESNSVNQFKNRLDLFNEKQFHRNDLL